MQSYKKYANDKELCKKILSEVLGFLKSKVDNDSLTLEEEQAFVRLIENNVPLVGTSEDFARYFRQSPGSVRTVIHRKMLSKPVRRVTYRFLDFLRIVPERWLNQRYTQTSDNQYEED